MMINPVLGREVRERLRSGRSFFAITLFLALLMFITWAAVASVSAANNDVSTNLALLTSSGRILLDALTIGMLVLMIFLLPGIAASSVTGERERQTLIPLQISLLRPRSILLGKVMSAAAFATLMLIAAAPMFGAAYMLGGVSVAEAVRTMLALIFVAALITTLSVAWSTILRRTASAVVISYATVMLLFVAAPITFGLLTALRQETVREFDQNGVLIGEFSKEQSRLWLLPNPVVAVALFQQPDSSGEGITGAFDGLRRGVRSRGWNGADGRERFAQSKFGIPDWVISFGSLAAVGAAASYVGTRRLRTPSRSER